MTRRYAVLESIEENHLITKDTDSMFWFQLQASLLLALKECGRLNEMQCRHAQEKLNQQKREWMKRRGGE